LKNWDKFIQESLRLELASKIMYELPCHKTDFTGVKDTEYNVLININDIIGSYGRGNQLWIDQLKKYRYAELDTNKNIENIAKEAYASLENSDYNLISYDDGKYYISDGHNRLTFLKFYIELYNKSPNIRVSEVIYFPRCDDKKKSFLWTLLSFFKSK
jgi:hypothetical protein